MASASTPRAMRTALARFPLQEIWVCLRSLVALYFSRNSGVVTTNHSGRKPKNSPRATREARTWRKGSAWRFTA